MGGWTCDGMNEAEGHGTNTGAGQLQREVFGGDTSPTKDSSGPKTKGTNQNHPPQNVCGQCNQKHS